MILSPVIRQRFFDASGNPLAGGKLYTYAAGTTTPQATYTNSTGTANANPIVLDANGEAALWLDPSSSYKFVLNDSSDVNQWTVDNASGLLADGVVVTAKLADGSVTTIKIADLAVTSAKLANDATIDANRAVTTNHIKDSAITVAKIADGALSADATGRAKMADGFVTTLKIADASVTQAKRAALGQQVSLSSGNFNTTSTSFVDITNNSVSLTTTGRPVLLALIPDGTANGMILNGQGNTIAVQILRDATLVATFGGTPSGVGGYTTASMAAVTIDAPVAGTYVYKAQVKAVSVSGTVVAAYVRLMALEL